MTNTSMLDTLGMRHTLLTTVVTPTVEQKSGVFWGFYTIGIVALRGIKAGEEIGFDYGSEYKITKCRWTCCVSEEING